MTILYIGGFRLPDKNAAAHRVLNMGRLLRSLGHEVVFVDTQTDIESRAPLTASRHLVDGFETYSVPYPTSAASWWQYFTSSRAFEEIAQVRGDVTSAILYNYPAVALHHIARYCSTHQIRTVADVTEWYGLSSGRAGFRAKARSLDTFLRMHFTHRQMDGLVVISDLLAQFYKRHPNVVLLPPMVDLSEPKWQGSPDRRAGGAAVSFIYSGDPGAKKDRLDAVIESFYAVRQSANFTFHVVGLTRADYEELHSGQSGILDELGDRVLFHGRLPHEESLQLVKSADYSILLRENSKPNQAGFPTKYVESVSAGTRVIANEVGSLTADRIAIHGGVLVEEPTCEALTRAVLPLLKASQPSTRAENSDELKRAFDYRNWTEEVAAFMKAVGA